MKDTDWREHLDDALNGAHDARAEHDEQRRTAIEICDAALVEQLQKAVAETRPAAGAIGPRADVWRACEALLLPDFVVGLRMLYEANAIVAFLFNTIVPHVEERLRYDTLQTEYDKAAAKPDAVAQNTTRFRAIVQALAEAE